jgi:hypothetical protein
MNEIRKRVELGRVLSKRIWTKNIAHSAMTREELDHFRLFVNKKVFNVSME